MVLSGLYLKVSPRLYELLIRFHPTTKKLGKMTLLISSNFLQLVVTALSVYWAGWIIYCRFFHPLRSIPGPFLASISRVWIVYKTGRGDMEYTQRALHKKYGIF